VSPTAEEAKATGVGGAGLPVTVASWDLQQNWVMMVHYFKLARFDLAKAEAAKFMAAKPEPEAVLALVESPKSGYDLIVSMVKVPEMGDAAAQILTLADQGARTRRTDPARIQENLHRLGQGPRAYFLAFKELSYSGEYVVPFALAILQDPNQKELAQQVYRTLVQIGEPVVLPLTRALASPDARLREQIVTILGDIGYPYSLPALKAIVEDGKELDSVKAAATKAILKFADESALKTRAKDLYIDLAKKYLSGKVTVADPRQPMTDVFNWVPGSGLLYRPAPTTVVADILAARACVDALKTDPGALEAVSLWVSALMDMEAKTPGKMARQDDPFLPQDMPSLAFFADAVGQQHLWRVLDQALRGGDTDIAVRACQALEKVANEDFLTLYDQGKEGSPLVMALVYPDQRVRFAAAFALAAVRPAKEFTGHTRVVPALVEALNLEARKSLLLVEPEADNRNRLQAKLKEAGWYVVTATSGDQALSTARSMLRIDAILISSRIKGNVDHGSLVTNLRHDYETAMTPIMVLSYADDPIKASWLESQDKFLKAVDPAAEAEALIPDIEALKKKAGSLVLDPDAARAVSLRAAETLADIARASRVFSIARARLSLLEALTNRPDELVVAVAGALSMIPDAEIEKALANVGTDVQRSKAVRVAALKALDRSARTIGNKLEDAQLASIQTLAGPGDDELRDAAGEALGGLNLDAAEGAKLILKYGQLGEAPPAAPAAVPAAPEEPAPSTELPVAPPTPTPTGPPPKPVVITPTAPPPPPPPPPPPAPTKGKGKGKGKAAAGA
jgi:HEAT repeat protein